MQVYETGPLRGLPRRAGHLQLVVDTPAVRSPGGQELIQEFRAYTYAGAPDINDQLDIPGIPADAAPPTIAVSGGRPFRSATPVVVILIACVLLYFAVRILGLPS